MNNPNPRAPALFRSLGCLEFAFAIAAVVHPFFRTHFSVLVAAMCSSFFLMSCVTMFAMARKVERQLAGG